MSRRASIVAKPALIVLATCLSLAAAPAVAQEQPPPTADAAGEGAELAGLRSEMEALFAEAGASHAALRENRPEPHEDGSPGLPAWLGENPGRAALTVLCIAARLEDGGATSVAQEAFVAVAPDPWRHHAAALAPHVRDLARESTRAAPGRIAAGLLQGVLAEAEFGRVWDTWFQLHPVVVRWRVANEAAEAASRPPVVDVPPGDTPLPESGSEGPITVARTDPPDPPDPPEPAEPEATTLVLFAKGRFEVGPWEGWIVDLDEKHNRRRKSSFKTIHVDRHEVTVGQYLQFLSALPADERPALLPDGWSLDDDGDPTAPDGLGPTHPVTGVSFLQASIYATSIGKRLPTEDEWERIASGGDVARLYPWGATAGDVRFGCREAGVGSTSPVEEFPGDVTPEGVLGLSGNVKELVAGTPDHSPLKGKVSADDRVIVRGGSFRTRSSECHTRWRWVIEAGAQEPDVGFRCVMDDLEYKRRR